jgi:hypothetical protein
MKKLLLILVLFLLMGTSPVLSQKIYPITSGEMIFSNGTLEFSDEYLAKYPEAQVSGIPLRFTAFFHLSQYWHFDFTGNVGIYSGLGVKNVGIISDEMLYNASPGIETYQPYKIIRRLYTGGIPLALKLGSFKDNLCFFGGAEFEFGIHYKEKYWNSHDRSGSKTKYTEWFGSQTQPFLPSAIAGVQFPGGINLKFKYYLNDFLNHDYVNKNFVSDLTRYKKSQVWYLSLSWQFNTAYLKSRGDSDINPYREN